MRWFAFSLVFVSFFCFTAVSSADPIQKLASEMSAVIGESGKKAIAVADFTDLDGQTTKLGRFLAEEFSVALAASGQGFQVIDRLHLKSLIREHELSESGVIDTSTAQKLGNIAGVEALITGTLTPFGDTIRVTAKILDTETARIIGAMTGDLPKTGAFAKLVESEIREAQARQVPRITPKQPQPSGEDGNAEGTMEVKETPEFKYSLISCIQNGETLTISFLAENKKKDQILLIDQSTRIFDNFGNQYHPSSYELGNKKANYSRYGSKIEHFLVQGIPTKMVFHFKGVPENASFVALMEFGNLKEKHSMRNIPISG
jgi:TolB-like protein